ncbi:MAG TPA: hypothetical protein VLF40_01380 [Candidatus Saccharimonadales bacterium]|nr:hypothetical protein [Candidatus Saccharimonadales bacterium]
MVLLDTLPAGPQSDHGHDQDETTQQLHQQAEQEHHRAAAAGRHRRRMHVGESLRHLFRRRRTDHSPRHAEWDADDNTVELNLHAADDTVELPIHEQAAETEESEESDTFHEISFSINRSALKHLDAEATRVEAERVRRHASETALHGKRFTAFRTANPHALEKTRQPLLAGYVQEARSQLEASLSTFRDEVVVALESGHKLDLLAVGAAYEQICTNGQSGTHASGELQLALRNATANPDFFNSSGSGAQAKSLLRTLYNIGALWDEKLVVGVSSPAHAKSEYGQARFNVPTYTISWLPGQEALPQATIKIAREKGDDEKEAAWNVTSESSE